MQYAKKTSKPTNYLKTVHTEHLVKLQTKHQQETELLDDLRNFCKTRASIEKEYATALQKLANSYISKKSVPLLQEPKEPSDKGRSLHSVWRTHIEQTLSLAEARTQYAEIAARISEQLKPAKSARVSTGKRLLEQLRSLQNDLANCTHELSRAQKYYGEEERHAHDIRHKAKNAAERVRNRDTGIFNSMANLQKNSAKLTTRREACETRSTSARNEYLFQLAAVNAHLRHYFLVDLPALTNTLDGNVYSRLRDGLLLLCRQEIDYATHANDKFTKLAQDAILINRDYSWKLFTQQHTAFVNVIQYEFFPLVGDAVTQLRSTNKEDDSLACIARKLARRVALRDRKMRAYQAELRAIQTSASAADQQAATTCCDSVGGAPSSSTGSIPSSSAEEMTGYNQEYLEHKVEELEEAVRREEIEKCKMEACLDLVRDVGIDVDELLRRSHAELAQELDGDMEQPYSPGSQDAVSVLSPESEDSFFFTSRRPALGQSHEATRIANGSASDAEEDTINDDMEDDFGTQELPPPPEEEEEEDDDRDQLPEGDRAVAIYEYRAQRPDELDLILEEDLIIVGEGDGPGWLLARSLVDGKEGFIPASFVVLTERRERSQPDGDENDHPYENWPPPTPARDKTDGDGGDGALRRPDSLPLGSGDDGPDPPPRKQGPEGHVVSAVHEFVAQSSDELSFKAGARILVLSCQANEVDDGWWRGRVMETGQEGVFPSMMISIEDMTLMTPAEMQKMNSTLTPISVGTGPPAFTPPPPVVQTGALPIPPPVVFTAATPCTCDDDEDTTPASDAPKSSPTLTSKSEPSSSASVRSVSSSNRGQDKGATATSRGQAKGATSASRGQEKGATSAIRGQDKGATSATRGQDKVATSAARGQEKGATSATRGQDKAATSVPRGQEKGATSATRGQDKAATSVPRGQEKGAATTARAQDKGSASSNRGQQAKLGVSGAGKSLSAAAAAAIAAARERGEDVDEGDYEDCGGDYVRLNTGKMPTMPGLVEEEEETII